MPVTFMPPGLGMGQTQLGQPNDPMAANQAAVDAWMESKYGKWVIDLMDQDRAWNRQQAEQEYGLKLKGLQMQARQLSLQAGAQKAQQWYQRETLKLQKQAQADARLNAERQFGLGLLDRQLQMSGPQNAFKYLDALEGTNKLQPESGFLRRMVTGQYAPATGGGLTGRATLEGAQADAENVGALQERRKNDLALIGQIAAKPEDYYATFRHADPFQQKYVQGGVAYGGGDPESFTSRMRRGVFANQAA